MKKSFLALLLVLMLIVPCALAETVEKNYEPEEGTGWLTCTIAGEEVEFTYVSSVKGITGTTHSFEADGFTMAIEFNSALEVGVAMTPNAIKSLEIVSASQTSRGYYYVKKTTSEDLVSEVLLETMTDEGLMHGTFSATAHPAERYVADVLPGILEDLFIEMGEFCFHQ